MIIRKKEKNAKSRGKFKGSNFSIKWSFQVKTGPQSIELESILRFKTKNWPISSFRIVLTPFWIWVPLSHLHAYTNQFQKKNAGDRRAWNYHRKVANGVINKENIVGIGQTRAIIPSSPRFDDEYGEILIPLLLSLSVIQLIYMW